MPIGNFIRNFTKKELKEEYKTLAKFVVKSLISIYKLEVYGKENIPKGKAVIAANHVSYLDVPFLVKALNEKIYFFTRPYFLPENDFAVKLYEKFVLSLDQILLKNQVFGKDALKSSLKVLNADNRNNKLCIFPEGTRGLNGKLGEIHEGAALISYLSKAPIIPTGIIGLEKIWPREKTLPKPYRKDKLHIGKPLVIDYTLEKKEAIRDLTSRLEKEISSLIEKD